MSIQDEIAQHGAEAVTRRNYREGQVLHIVLFRYQDGVAEAEQQEVARRFVALQDSPRDDGRTYIRSIQTGTQVSAEATVVADFDAGFVVTFDSLGDRNFYVGAPIITDPALIDAAHGEFKEFVGGYLAPGGVAVFDLVP